MSKFSTALRLPVADWLAFGEAAACMVWARILILFVPLRHWRRQIHAGSAEITPLDARSERAARRVRHAIARVSRNTPVELNCLPQALSARWMLARRGVETQLFIGTRFDEESAHKFHAWLKAGGWWVTGRCREDEYHLFAPPR